jgi:hypothetical protein
VVELKGEVVLDVVPPRHYWADRAWQQLSGFAHNLIRSLQLDILAALKPRSRKRTYTCVIRSMRTLRFPHRRRRPGWPASGGRHVLRLSHNLASETLYAPLNHRLAAELFSGWG